MASSLIQFNSAEGIIQRDNTWDFDYHENKSGLCDQGDCFANIPYENYTVTITGKYKSTSVFGQFRSYTENHFVGKATSSGWCHGESICGMFCSANIYDPETEMHTTAVCKTDMPLYFETLFSRMEIIGFKDNAELLDVYYDAKSQHQSKLMGLRMMDATMMCDVLIHAFM